MIAENRFVDRQLLRALGAGFRRESLGDEAALPANIGSDGSGDLCDCSPAEGRFWAVPGETGELSFEDRDRLVWSAPAEPGGTELTYDTLRSGTAADFVVDAICVEWDDGSDTMAEDTDFPLSGVLR